MVTVATIVIFCGFLMGCMDMRGATQIVVLGVVLTVVSLSDVVLPTSGEYGCTHIESSTASMVCGDKRWISVLD